MNSINGTTFKEMLAGGVKALELNRALIDELNVFPVPDGDTGTNMSLTISTAMREVGLADTNELDKIALAFSKGALKGARGNSGVILSQIFKGFAVALDNKTELTAKDFAEAMKKGTEIAYGAVTKPKEGTILTVIRVASENAVKFAKGRNVDFVKFLSQVIEAGEQILAKTPEMLPVLAKAGVVDAGGRGLMTIFEGFYAVLTGEEIKMIKDDAVRPAALIVNANGTEATEEDILVNDYDNITFQYCTEFFITHLNSTTTLSNIDKFRDYLMTIGDCVLVIGDLELVKTHVHTNHPDQALKAALKLGELDGVKIENMVEQNRKIKGENDSKKKTKREPEKDFAMVSICAGDGLSAIFKDLMVDVVVEGGQTMNPSVYDILGAINSAGGKNVYVLPNNPNIIFAAEQAKELADVNVFVIPTTCTPEGISAALAFSPDCTAEENYENMKASFGGIKTVEVTHAVRNTRMNGFSVKEGDIIAISNKKIIAKSTSITEATLNSVRKICTDCDMVTLYYGEGVAENEAMHVAEVIEAEYPDLEVAAYYGGQPHYYYILSAE
ncbi:MAG: DAK2 domain-containing protein [Clostridia bacterium]|nr:DAK2 domain-containing protein [Clostridia bacterium]